MDINVNPGDAIIAAQALLRLARETYERYSITAEDRLNRVARAQLYERVAAALAPSVRLSVAEREALLGNTSCTALAAIEGASQEAHRLSVLGCRHGDRARVMVPCPCPSECMCRTEETSFGRCAREGEGR